MAFNNIVVAQQNLGRALQRYLTAPAGQWQAVSHLSGLLQVDELYSVPPAPHAAPVQPSPPPMLVPPGPADKK